MERSTLAFIWGDITTSAWILINNSIMRPNLLLRKGNWEIVKVTIYLLKESKVKYFLSFKEKILGVGKTAIFRWYMHFRFERFSWTDTVHPINLSDRCNTQLNQCSAQTNHHSELYVKKQTNNNNDNKQQQQKENAPQEFSTPKCAVGHKIVTELNIFLREATEECDRRKFGNRGKFQLGGNGGIRSACTRREKRKVPWSSGVPL